MKLMSGMVEQRHRRVVRRRCGKLVATLSALESVKSGATVSSYCVGRFYKLFCLFLEVALRLLAIEEAFDRAFRCLFKLCRHERNLLNFFVRSYDFVEFETDVLHGCREF